MKLSTRSRYGTRLVLDMAQNYLKGPTQLGAIARRQGVSVKYLEQIIIPLKKANLVKSIRGAKGGHVLSKPPEEITVGQIVLLLEKDPGLAECALDPEICPRSDSCPTRIIWKEATDAIYRTLNAITLADLVRASGTERSVADE